MSTDKTLFFWIGMFQYLYRKRISKMTKDANSKNPKKREREISKENIQIANEVQKRRKISTTQFVQPTQFQTHIPISSKKNEKKVHISQMEKIRREIESYVISTNQNNIQFEDLANKYFLEKKFKKRNFLQTRFRLNTGNGKLRIWKNTRILVLSSANSTNLEKCAAYKIDDYLPMQYEKKKLSVDFKLFFTHKNSSKERFMERIKKGEPIQWEDTSKNLRIKDKEHKVDIVGGKNYVCYSVKFQIKGGRNPNNSHHGIFYLLRKTVLFENKIISGTQFVFRRFSYKNNEETEENNSFMVDSYEEI